MQCQEKSRKGLPHLSFFPVLPRSEPTQASSAAVSHFLRGTYFHQTTLVRPKVQIRLELSLETSTEASIRINQDTSHTKSHTKPKGILRKSRNQKSENQGVPIVSRGWNKVSYKSVAQRRQEPGVKTKQTRMKSRRVRSKTPAKWHCRLPRATGGVAWHICY